MPSGIGVRRALRDPGAINGRAHSLQTVRPSCSAQASCRGHPSGFRRWPSPTRPFRPWAGRWKRGGWEPDPGDIDRPEPAQPVERLTLHHRAASDHGWSRPEPQCWRLACRASLVGAGDRQRTLRGTGAPRGPRGRRGVGPGGTRLPRDRRGPLARSPGHPDPGLFPGPWRNPRRDPPGSMGLTCSDMCVQAGGRSFRAPYPYRSLIPRTMAPARGRSPRTR